MVGAAPRTCSMRPRSRCARVLAPLAVAALAGATLAACSPGPVSEPRDTTAPTQAGAAAKTGTGEVRHDLDPLASRIPALTDVDEATWLSGTLGDPGVPGPSLYWIDAVVTLPEGAADRLRDSLELTPAGSAPEVVEALASSVPPGDLLVGAGLDDAFSTDGWRSTVFLEADGERLVLAAVGQ